MINELALADWDAQGSCCKRHCAKVVSRKKKRFKIGVSA